MCLLIWCVDRVCEFSTCPMALVVPGAGAIPNPLSVIAATGRGGGEEVG